jgi:hypothetical protein
MQGKTRSPLLGEKTINFVETYRRIEEIQLIKNPTMHDYMSSLFLIMTSLLHAAACSAIVRLAVAIGPVIT